MRRKRKNSRDASPATPLDALAARAESVVREVVASLPDDLRALAESVPVFYAAEIPPHWLCDGVEPDSLGLFSGSSLADPCDSECTEAPAITFFLRNIRDYCRDEGLSFDEEVRVTYLHEFGHYLGLGEDDMEVRGLR